MKAITFDGEALRVVERARPVAPVDEEIVELVLAGVCGTDLEIAKGYMGFRGVLGHELVGRVNGQRVAAEINASCGVCSDCRKGNRNHCPTRTVMGILGRDGAFAEQLAVPRACLWPLPDEVRDEAAVFVEPLAAAVHVLDAYAPTPFDRVAVVGDGRLGLLIALALATTRAKLVLIGHHEASLAIAARAGVEVTLEADLAARKEFDLVVDATGHEAGLARALSLVRPRGTLVLKSTFAARSGVDLAPIVIDEIDVRGSRCGPFDRAIAALREGLVDPTPLIKARFKLEQGVEALAAAGQRGMLKVLIEP